MPLSMLPLLWLGAAAQATPKALVVIDALPTTLLPLYARTDADRRTAALLFEPLFYRSALGAQLESKLVERYAVEVGDQGPAITLQLSSEAQWADGNPIDGEDLCFTIDALVLDTNPVSDSAAHRSRLAGCTVGEDPTTATVTFRRPVPDPRDWLQLSVLPAHAFSSPSIPPDHPFSRAAVGSKDRTAVLHDDQVSITAHAPRSRPQHIQVQSTAGNMEGAAVVEVRVPTAAGAPPDPTLRRFDSRELWHIAIRHTGPLAEADARQVLDAALDRTQLIEAVWGTGPTAPVPVTGPFLHTSPFSNRSLTHRTPQDAPANASAPLQMGFYTADASVEPRLGPALVSLLASRGVAITLVPLPNATATLPPDIDLLLMRWVPPQTDHVGPLLHPDGAQNPFQTADSTALALWTAMDAAPTAPEEQAAAHALHAHLHASTYALWLTEGDARSRWPAELPRIPLTPGTYWTELR
ncbi:MAG: hypothetical protein CL927_12975 [Deltaproteobacteria bacterium]|nr:hypothetical protein [Deltaproteobacteria bacterium]HCH66024.1 hypothetical protein [Deltaproteobacteria bacterium]